MDYGTIFEVLCAYAVNFSRLWAHVMAGWLLGWWFGLAAFCVGWLVVVVGWLLDSLPLVVRSRGPMFDGLRRLVT